MTKDTMPRHIWMHEVITLASVSVEEAQPYREKLNRWYNAGESVSMSSHDLSFCVREGKRQVRLEEQAEKDSKIKI